jgi:spermidine synthase
MRKIFFLHLNVFLSAFLLFQIELIVAKAYLPVFGGGYLVWGACVVFFQLVLLLGYFYAHIVIRKLGMQRYLGFHALLLLLPLVFSFPGRPLMFTCQESGLPAVFLIFRQLAFTIGLVFFALSTASVISQGWLVSSTLPEAKNPYVLFAVSNLGSFAALLSYPFIFEPYSDIGQQLALWRIGYVLLLVLHFISWKLIKVNAQEDDPGRPLNRRITKTEIAWLLFSAAGVMLFLSVTNVTTYEVAPIPLLWVLPLGIYLLSFVLNFKQRPWCPLWIREGFHLNAGLSIIFFFLTGKRFFPMILAFLGYLWFLFVICMFVQYELARRRPQDDRDLTFFYALVSLGGFLGGIVVTWLIPLVSVSMVEYFVGLLVIATALRIDQGAAQAIPGLRWAFYGLGLLAAWPLLFKQYHVLGIALIVTAGCLIYSRLRHRPQAFWLNITAIIICAPLLDLLWNVPREDARGKTRFSIYNFRNYYAVYKVYFENGRIYLKNGSIWHSIQYADPRRQNIPIGYYQRKAPIGGLLTADNFSFKRVGIIGLGAGVLAAYFNPAQTVDFFELDPDVYGIAKRYFAFLRNGKARQEFIFGDARIQLRKDPAKKYDLLIVDAFSGDSVPVHLLTVEAIAEYRRHLNPGGRVVFHVSNRYLRLARVLFKNAEMLSAYVSSKRNEASPEDDLLITEWVALTWDYQVFKKLVSGLKWGFAQPPGLKKIRPWTDKYTNLLSVLRLDWLLEQLKNFTPFYW